MLDWLVGISPWWWFALGVVLGVLEMATMSFFLIWPALAALVMALVLVMVPDASGELQITVFAVLAVVFTLIGRALLNRYGDGGGEVALNDRARMMIGRHGEVVAFRGPEGTVVIDDIRWQARWPAGQSAAPGDTVRVVDAEGMTLLVENA